MIRDFTLDFKLEPEVRDTQSAVELLWILTFIFSPGEELWAQLADPSKWQLPHHRQICTLTLHNFASFTNLHDLYGVWW